MKRMLIAIALLALTSAHAEPQRTQLTHENRLPDPGGLEVGAAYTLTQFEFSEERSLEPYVRYGLFEELTVSLVAPFKDIDPDFGSGETGLGDLELGAELLAYEDIFDYPYVIPHATLVLDTGDEDDGLGRGETYVVFGTSVGTVVADQLHFIGDLSYSVFNDSDNIAAASLSLIWDISEKFAVLTEGRVTDEDDGLVDSPATFLGGMSYEPTEDWTIVATGGSVDDSAEDVIASLKVARDF